MVSRGWSVCGCCCFVPRCSLAPPGFLLCGAPFITKWNLGQSRFLVSQRAAEKHGDLLTGYPACFHSAWKLLGWPEHPQNAGSWGSAGSELGLNGCPVLRRRGEQGLRARPGTRTRKPCSLLQRCLPTPAHVWAPRQGIRSDLSFVLGPGKQRNALDLGAG